MTPFDDLHSYVSIPRVTGLRLSPDGTWLAATVQQPDPDGTKYSTSIWRIPAADAQSASGAQPARLTQSAQGEDGPAFLPDGSLLFASRRPDPAAGSAGKKKGQEDGAKSALWLLPRGGQPGPVGREPQPGHPWDRDVVVKVLERGHLTGPVW